MDNIDNKFSRSFFADKIRSTKREYGFKIPPSSEIYITNLLVSYMCKKEIFEDEALCMAFLKATQEKDVETFKRLGDFILMRIGVFPGSLTRRMKNANYFKALGSSCYGKVYDYSRKTSVKSTYKDLSTNFDFYVDLLLMLSENFKDELKLDKKYDLWLHTKSNIIKKQMAKEGIILVEFGDEEDEW